MAEGKGLSGAMKAVTGLVFLAAAAIALIGMRGCDETAAQGDVVLVKINGKAFHLEAALDNETRFKGLSGRTHIEPDGGMLFVFTRPMETHFVMRDCPIPIDIIFLDASGRVVAFHEMTPEPPRGPDEQAINPLTSTNDKYEARLPKYPSRFPAQFVIELAGGTLKGLGIKNGDKVELDVSGLKSRAK